MNKVQQGFTLIELMIVVAIIGILAAVAIPAYQDYTVRAKVTEGLSLASAAKTGVSEWFATNGNFPSANASVGLPTAASITGNSVRSVSIGNNGVITVTFAGTGLPTSVAGDTILLTPTNNNGAVAWSCTGGTLDSKYRP
ncbi:MAG: prepilin-type N-terminal cleavage/methylation domain-containing protein, partial [Gammaproteobacteria bacterium]